MPSKVPRETFTSPDEDEDYFPQFTSPVMEGHQEATLLMQTFKYINTSRTDRLVQMDLYFIWYMTIFERRIDGKRLIDYINKSKEDPVIKQYLKALESRLLREFNIFCLENDIGSSLSSLQDLESVITHLEGQMINTYAYRMATFYSEAKKIPKERLFSHFSTITSNHYCKTVLKINLFFHGILSRTWEVSQNTFIFTVVLEKVFSGEVCTDKDDAGRIYYEAVNDDNYEVAVMNDERFQEESNARRKQNKQNKRRRFNSNQNKN